MDCFLLQMLNNQVQNLQLLGEPELTDRSFKFSSVICYLLRVYSFPLACFCYDSNYMQQTYSRPIILSLNTYSKEKEIK